MKKILAIVLVLLTSGTLAYASPISQQWVKTYGGPEDDSFNCIQQTMDGGYVATGHTRSFAPGLIIYLWVLKFDVNGNVLWQKTYPYGSFINDGYTIQQTSDGGYIVGGFTSFPVKSWMLRLDSNGDIVWQKTYDEIIQFYAVQQTANEGYVAIGPNNVLKIDSDGNVAWHKVIKELPELNSIQQTSDGGYIITGDHSNSDYNILVIKLDSNGNPLWQKTYYGTYSYSIQMTSDGGYIVAGEKYGAYALVFKLDSSGNILWQKAYDGSSHDWIVSIQQTADGGYTTVGTTRSDIWIMKLNEYGNIIWQKTYGGDMGDYGIYYDKTLDGGYVVAGNTDSFDADGLMILKLDSNGEIPGCDIIEPSDVQVIDMTVIAQDISLTVESRSLTATNTDAFAQDISVEISEVCYYENPTDVDGDGIENDPGDATANSMYVSSFLAEEDNCSEAPNGPFLGTCTKGNVGSTCIANEACGVDGICSMYQEDSYPPQGNGIGDACDCEGNFDCDSDCDGTDAATFKMDFGRSTFLDPCTNEDQCKGDFDCDVDVDGTDAALFKVDFGRSGFNNPCPACVVEDWCVYP
jgi:hypothetical protein